MDAGEVVLLHGEGGSHGRDTVDVVGVGGREGVGGGGRGGGVLDGLLAGNAGEDVADDGVGGGGAVGLELVGGSGHGERSKGGDEGGGELHLDGWEGWAWPARG